MDLIKGLCVSYLDVSTSDCFKENKIKEETFKEITNILEEKEVEALRDGLVLLTANGAIDISDNIGNNFEEEREVKILDVDSQELIKKLIALGAEKVFDGTIDDVYLDLPGNILEDMNLNRGYKVSFRMRFKISKEGEFSLFYTIKRKKPKDKNSEITTRDCYEKEYKILKPSLIIYLLKGLDLFAYRRKIKERVAFVLNGVKFDIDKYPDFLISGGIDPEDIVKVPTWLEIETGRVDQIPGVLGMLNLENNTRSSSGSRGVLEGVYGIPRDHHNIKDIETSLLLPNHLLEEREKKVKQAEEKKGSPSKKEKGNGKKTE